MTLGPPLSAQLQRRHSERVLLRIPVEVKGQDAAGKPFTEVTHTLVINRDGARIALKQMVKQNDRVTITNLRSKTSCPFRLVGQERQSLGEGPEWGVECLERNLGFWGIEFPDKGAPKNAPSQEEEIVDALIECSICHFRELAQLKMAQFRMISERSSILRNCVRCLVPTDWRMGSADGDGPKSISASSPAAATPQGADRRQSRRMTVKLPVRLRLIDGKEEVTRTENLSKTGVCFISSVELVEGQAVNLTVGYEPGKNESEVTAHVIWRQPLAGTSRTIYGVHLEE